jgi:two-component system chemotaxis response regulator CheY
MRILVVDDDPVSRELISAVLEPYGKCDVAVDADSAYQRFIKAHEAGLPYEFISLDIELPGPCGRALLNDIRAWEEKASMIPNMQRAVIFMATSHGNARNVMGSFRSGCDGYLVKPLRAEEVYESLAKVGIRKPTRSVA